MDVASENELTPSEEADEDKNSEKKSNLKKRCICYWTTFNTFYQSLLLTFLVIIYLLVGAAIFVALEAPEEEQRIVNTAQSREAIIQNLIETYNLTREEVDAIISRFTVACDSDLLVPDTARIWNFGNAIFFASTVVTTIGYGNLSPSTPPGQSFCVIYALFGIPLTVAFLAVLGQLLGHLPKLIISKLKDKAIYVRYAIIFCFGIGGVVLFLIFPALIFQAIEGWTYREAMYYAFVTLSTIGFGDFVAGQQADRPENLAVRELYRVCLAFWVFFGLAFLAILLTDVGNAMSTLWKKIKLRLHRAHKKIKSKRELKPMSKQSKASETADEEAGSVEKDKDLVPDTSKDTNETTPSDEGKSSPEPAEDEEQNKDSPPTEETDQLPSTEDSKDQETVKD